MALNYSSLSLAALKKELKKLEKAIAAKESESKRVATAQITAIAKDAGIDLTELQPSNKPTNTAASASRKKGRPGAKRGKVAPKYKHPNDPKTTWTGRGRQPVWIREHLQNGGTLDSVTI